MLNVLLSKMSTIKDSSEIDILLDSMSLNELTPNLPNIDYLTRVVEILKPYSQHNDNLPDDEASDDTD